MIVTRRWLEEFIDLEGIDNSTLYDTFNRIGLEVDRIESYAIPRGVVIGKIVACEKHPHADKLNVCQIDIGTAIKQIVCGAANVREAEYVAVATLGSTLPNGMSIKPVTLRGIESEGMVCSAGELGLPQAEDGIWILDESIGELEPGKELQTYTNINDTLIELELTANRGDCLSVYGVARDLSAGLGIKCKPFEYKQKERFLLGIGRKAEFHIEGEIHASVRYKLADIKRVNIGALVKLRLAFAQIEYKDNLDALLLYTTHATGVMLRCYDAEVFRMQEKFRVALRQTSTGKVEVLGKNNTAVSMLGAYQQADAKASEATQSVLFEAFYIEPEPLVAAISSEQIQTDALYYQSSRGSNPDLYFGTCYLTCLLDRYCQIEWYEGVLEHRCEIEQQKIVAGIDKLSQILGIKLEQRKVAQVLHALGFDVRRKDHDEMVITSPLFRHDIRNVHDIAEEIMRIIGIDAITSKPMRFQERMSQDDIVDRYYALRALRQRAISQGFFEHISYLFAPKAIHEKYQVVSLDSALELANPIAEELNTLRTTLAINLLSALKHNVNHTQKRIMLFEVGTVFDAQRNPSEKIAFLYSGYQEPEGVRNSGKPRAITFDVFVSVLQSILGPMSFCNTTPTNDLMHPYQSATAYRDQTVCGTLFKLHPKTAQDLGVFDTYIAEFDVDALLPSHINAQTISKFQGAYKDLSIVIDKTLSYDKVHAAIQQIKNPLIKRFYPIDIYEDRQLGEKKSLTIRFFIQSDTQTLEDAQIDATMKQVLHVLQESIDAQLR